MLRTHHAAAHHAGGDRRRSALSARKPDAPHPTSARVAHTDAFAGAQPVRESLPASTSAPRTTVAESPSCQQRAKCVSKRPRAPAARITQVTGGRPAHGTIRQALDAAHPTVQGTFRSVSRIHPHPHSETRSAALLVSWSDRAWRAITQSKVRESVLLTASTVHCLAVPRCAKGQTYATIPRRPALSTAERRK